MLNNPTIIQACNALLSRHETIKEAFFSRAEDGIFDRVAKLHYPERYELDQQYYEWQTNDRAEGERIAKVRQIWLGYEILTDSLKLDI